MADLRAENPATTEQFAKLMADQGVRLPLGLDPDNIGVVVDANGNGIITVDVNGELPDDQADKIAACVMLAVNTCGGFRAEVDRG